MLGSPVQDVTTLFLYTIIQSKTNQPSTILEQSTDMTSNYSGQLPQFLDNNKKYVSEVFPTLPKPWSMGPQRQMVKPSGLATFVCSYLTLPL